MKSYSSFIFPDEPDWSLVPEAKIDEFCWEQGKVYRPDCRFKMCAVRGRGVYARLTALEDNPLTVYRERDEAVFLDSCLEFFFCPFGRKGGYINIETNSFAAFLAEFGFTRGTRKKILTMTYSQPEVKPFKIEGGWGVEIFLSDEFISELYASDFSISPGEYYGNFYKCGDATEIPHYCAYFPVDDFLLGFHNPARFGSIILKEVDN